MDKRTVENNKNHGKSNNDDGARLMVAFKKKNLLIVNPLNHCALARNLSFVERQLCEIVRLTN